MFGFDIEAGLFNFSMSINLLNQDHAAGQCSF